MKLVFNDVKLNQGRDVMKRSFEIQLSLLPFFQSHHICLNRLILLPYYVMFSSSL